MGLIAEFRSRARHVVGPAMGICAAGYFAYHMVHGDRGLHAWWGLKGELASAEMTLEEISEQRAQLENRVWLLRPDSLDPDLLDERVRLMLNLGRPGEIVIFDLPERHPPVSR